MKAIDRLLSLKNHRLVVFKDVDGNICVDYEKCWIEDGIFLTCTCGRGATFEIACEDFMKNISGKTLVFDYSDGSRKTVTVL